MYFLPYVALFRLHRAAIDARRRNRRWPYLAWSAIAAASAVALTAIAAAFVSLLFDLGLWWAAGIMIGVLVAPLVGPPVIRHVLVPLGAHRLAYYTAYVSRPGPDPQAYALCVAAWALAHAPSGAGEAWGEAWITRRRDLRLPLGDAEVIATGLLAAARGDATSARRLLRSVQMLVEDHPMVRELAGEWLACDAAERGAWGELADDARAARWPATPLTYLLEGVAARRLDAPGAPSPRELWARWLLAPHRRVTHALVRAATAPATAPGSGQRVAGDAPAPIAIDALPRAIASHLALAAEVTADELTTAVSAWDAALTDAATRAWLADRARELDAAPDAADRALRELATEIAEELARIAEAAELGAPASPGPIGGELARRLRHGRLDALESGFTRWAQRRHTGEAHAAIDEWREFVALHAAYAAAVTAGGLELRRLAFPHAYSTGSNMAAWLWNTRSEYVLSHAISRWLLDEALAVGDAEAIELGNRNCGLTVPTRTGDR